MAMLKTHFNHDACDSGKHRMNVTAVEFPKMAVRVSQPPPGWHIGLDNSLLWGLSCALQDVQQHPWPLPKRFQ